MTRVLHTGDTHLGYQQYHSPERQRDFLAAFRQVVADAIESEVDAVVHAGDLFHDRRPRLQDIMGALDVLGDLEDADIPFLAIVGNHEGKRDAQWLDLYESLGLATRLDESPTVVGDTAFYGLDFVARARREALDYEFDPHDASHAALVSHGLFEPFEHGDWDAREIIAKSPVDFDALLLGDDHTPRRRESDGTWLTYCGSTERASADEREARGYNLVTFDDGVDIRRRSIDTRPFVFVDVELAADEGTDRVRERVGQEDLTDAVVIVTIEGEGERVPPATIEEFAREQGALIARVNDRREIDEESAYEVQFADPDDAVRERIDQLGLSPAAAELDEVVRASKVADSNVDDAVEARTRELIDRSDDSQFEPAPAEENEATADSGGSTGDRTDEQSVAGDRSISDGDEASARDNEPTTAAEDDMTPDETKTDGQPEDGDGQPDDTDGQSGDGAEQPDDGDGQATMGEYL